MPDFKWIGSGVSEPQVAENDHLPLTWHIALTTVYALTCYTVIFRATVIAKLTYCSPAWAGSCSAAECSRINSFLTRCKCFGFCDNNLQAIEVLFSKADDAFSQHIINNNLHVLQTFLLESPEVQYHFRPRLHDKLLIPKTVDLSKRDFIIHLLNCYWLFLHFIVLSFVHCLSYVCQLFFIKDWWWRSTTVLCTIEN